MFPRLFLLANIMSYISVVTNISWDFLFSYLTVTARGTRVKGKIVTVTMNIYVSLLELKVNKIYSATGYWDCFNFANYFSIQELSCMIRQVAACVIV